MDLGSLRRWIYTHPVITILAAGVIFRLVFFNLVEVNYDAGLYLYDTKLLLEGQIPLIDYLSRSPLFHAFLSPAILLDFSPIVTARIQMILVSLTLGVVVYLATTKLHSREAGIIAMAVFVLAPFELVWGLWLKTEQVAQLLVLAGLLPLLGHLDDERIPVRDLVLLGGAVGAAFFVRRVVIVHFGVILLFLLYYRYRVKGKSLVDPISRGTVFGISAGVTLLIGYLVWSGGSAGNFVELLNTHLLGLVSEPASAGNAAGGDTGILAGLYSFVYGVAASNFSSLFTYIQAVVVLLPVMLLLLIYPIAFLRREIGNTRTFGIFAVLGVGAILSAFFVHIAPFTESSWLAEVLIVAVIVCLGLAAIALTPRFEGGSDTLLWSPKLLLPAGLALTIVVSYAVRDKGMFVTYFQDVFPYLAMLTGVAVVVLWQETKLEVPKKVAWGALLAIAIVVSFSMASPLVVGPAAGGTQITVTDAVAIGNDLNDEFGDDAQGFSAQPLYMLEADHRVANDFSRKYWIVSRGQDTKRSQQIRSKTAAELESGNISYIIIEKRTENILAGQLQSSFENNFCDVTNEKYFSRTYERAGIDLYVHKSLIENKYIENDV